MGDAEKHGITERLATLETKLDAIIEALRDAASVRHDQEQRIRTLEKNLWLAVGGGAVVMAVAQLVLYKIAK